MHLVRWSIYLLLLLPLLVKAQDRIILDTTETTDLVLVDGDSTLTDSTAAAKPLPKWLATRTVTYTIGRDEYTEYVLDTSLDDRQFYDHADLNDYQYRNIGNWGQPLVPLTFVPEGRFGYDVGHHQYDRYMFTPESIRWYDSKQPFTRLLLIIGGAGEQGVSVVHNQRVKQRFNFSFQYDRVASEGSYSRQTTNLNNIAVTSRFRSKKDFYRFRAMYSFKNMTMFDNGGVTSTGIFGDTSFVTSAIVDVNILNAQTTIRQSGGTFQQELNFMGEAVEYQVDDTTRGRAFFPELQLFHEFGYSFYKYRFVDQSPDSAYYEPTYLSSITDSLDASYSHILYSNRAGVSYAKVLDADSMGATYRNFYFEAAAVHEYYQIAQNFRHTGLSNLSIEAQVRDHPKSDMRFKYGFMGQFVLAGYNQGDMELNARAGYDLKKLGLFGIEAFFRDQRPDWTARNVVFNDTVVAYNLDKERLFTGGVYYQLPKWRTKLHAQYNVISNYIYWNSNAQPEQEQDELVNFWTFTAEQNFRVWHFGLDNLIRVYVPTSANKRLRFPTYWGKHSLFFFYSLFKNNLDFRIGLDVFYNTNYQPYGYNPLVGQFYLQDKEQLKYYPVMDVYISFQVAELAIFFKMQHVNQGMFKQNGYFSAYPYPAAGRQFKLGLSWRFYN